MLLAILHPLASVVTTDALVPSDEEVSFRRALHPRHAQLAGVWFDFFASTALVVEPQNPAMTASTTPLRRAVAASFVPPNSSKVRSRPALSTADNLPSLVFSATFGGVLPAPLDVLVPFRQKQYL